MTEEHFPNPSSAQQLPQPPKRRRTPSQYATQIADFKNNLVLPSKKTKSIRFLDPLQQPQEQGLGEAEKPLPCVLPNGKRLLVTIVAESNRSLRAQRSQRRRLKRAESVTSNRPKQEKKQDASVCLLDKFLSAFQNLQKEQENDSKQPNSPPKQNPQTRLHKREEKVRREKEREDKWNKCYDRYRALSERLERLQETYIFLI